MSKPDERHARNNTGAGKEQRQGPIVSRKVLLLLVNEMQQPTEGEGKNESGFKE